MNSGKLSRRGLLKGVGSVGLAAAGSTVLGVVEGVARGETGDGVSAATPVARAATPFAVGEVELMAGPFLEARRRSQQYLLSLDPDRLLHTFRVNAVLAPKAAVYGGWESNPTWTEIHCQGHSLGHYLSGCSLMFGSTGDVRFKQRADYIVAELQACQTAGGTGLVTAFPEGNRLMEDVLTGKKYSGVPWYTLHKVYAGLRDASLYTNNPAAKEVLLKFCDWAVTATAPLTEAQFQRMLDEEHGGMNEVLADVYEMTGDERYLKLARRFCHQAVLDPLARGRDHLDGMHANTQIPKIIGFERLYQQTGQKEYGAAAEFFWKTVTSTRSFVNGNHGDNEHFFPVADFSEHVFSAKTSETCCDYNMLKLTRALFERKASAAYADFYERALYNDILASQDPDSGMVTYFQGHRPGYMKLYCTPVDSFWCCTGTGMENHAKYQDSIYFRGENVLFVNLFVPSVVRWSKGATLTQTTRFPEEASTKLQWKTEGAVETTVKLRHPQWCRVATVKVNGKVVAVSRQPSSYVELKRVWHDGDVIEMDLPMELKAVALPGNERIVAFVYGPIVLAGALGNEGIPSGGDILANERAYGSVLKSAFVPPVLSGDGAGLVRQAKAAGKPLQFDLPAKVASTKSVSSAVRLKPYYQIAHERYAVYWQLGAEDIG